MNDKIKFVDILNGLTIFCVLIIVPITWFDQFEKYNCLVVANICFLSLTQIYLLRNMKK